MKFEIKHRLRGDVIFSIDTDSFKMCAEFRSVDIAAIPISTNGKFRVSRCKIIGEKDMKKYYLR